MQQLCLERMLPYFFAAGHFHYARYSTQHLLKMFNLSGQAKDEITSGAFVCRHQAGTWNSVSSDQFGEQTAIRIGKGGLRGVTLSSELVKEWIDCFPTAAYVSNTINYVYCTDDYQVKRSLTRRRVTIDGNWMQVTDASYQRS